jgi:hypothetical protein
MAEPFRLSPLQRAALGLFFGGIGLLFFLVALRLVPLATSALAGASWLEATAGSVFLAAGVALLLGRASTAVSAVAGLLIVGGLAAIANYLAFAAGEQVCSGSGCLVAIGYAALVLDAFLLAVLARLAQKVAGGPPKLNALTRAVKGVLMVVLSPLLLLLFLWTAGRTLVARARNRKTGS